MAHYNVVETLGSTIVLTQNKAGFTWRYAGSMEQLEHTNVTKTREDASEEYGNWYEARCMDEQDRDSDVTGYYSDNFSDYSRSGSGSALHAATGDRCPSCRARVGVVDDFCKHCGKQLSPRKFPCPTCNAPHSLTREDKAKHYQCDRCADRDEGKYGYSDY